MFIKRKGQRAGTSFAREVPGGRKLGPPDQHDVRYSHLSHKAYNEELKARQNPSSLPLDIEGPWMNKDVLSRVPNMRRDFDLNRDPLIAAQMEDEGKTEAQRRREQMGRGSTMVGRDQPKPKFRPSHEISQKIDRGAFNARWMREQRDAAMARARPADEQPDNQRSQECHNGISQKFPSR